MTISYAQGYDPFWTIFDLLGRPAAGAKLYSYRSLQKTSAKAIYMDPAGVNAWPNPITFPENGQTGAFYFTVDTNNLQETYYLVLNDANGNLIWNIDGYLPTSGTGGGSIITSAFDFYNYIVNNVFWRNIGTSATPLPTQLTVAPSVHEGVQTPDIVFTKNGTGATDTITFTPFTLGSTPLTGDVTPAFFLNHTVGAPGTDTLRVIQFPIVQNVQNLSNTEMTVEIWARDNAPAHSFTLNWIQFFGDGGGSTSTTTPIGVCALTGGWQFFSFTVSTPNPSGKAIGACGNDTLYLQIAYPASTAFNIDIAKPRVYLGSIAPDQEFQTNDYVNSIISSPRTGDARISLNSFAPFGWVPADDGTIGSATSGAVTRANIDTFNLYALIWNSTTQALAPITGGKGATAVADFIANKSIQLTRTLGRAIAGALPLQSQNTVPYSTSVSQTFTASGATDQLTVSSTTNFWTGVPVTVSNSGGSLPVPLVANTVYYAINLTATTLELATTPENAIAGTFINLTSNGSGTNTIVSPAYPLGTFVGEVTNTLTVANLAPHTHTIASQNASGTAPPKFNYSNGALIASGSTDSTGSGTPFSILSPVTFYNVFLKL